jgi:hypothetical protein
MRKVMLAAVALAVALAAGPVGSQDAGGESEATEERSRPVRMIRVLQDPYDLASFYSTRPGAPGVTPPVPDDPAYALASFYRSRQAGPGSDPGPWIWAAFWAHGYGARRPAPLVGYRRRIGENGDLFLAVPFLAPVGPLSGAVPGF